jgi:hypothetical protein
MSLSQLNDILEGTDAIPDTTWTEWLWKTDPEEPITPGILLNRCHLVGLLVSRYQARAIMGEERDNDGIGGTTTASAPAATTSASSKTTPTAATSGSSKTGDDRMSLMAKSPLCMTLRELKDTVDNILIEWPRFLQRLGENPKSHENLQAVVGLVDKCLARFGHLAENPGRPETFDDAGCTEPYPGASGGHSGEDAIRLTRTAMRRMLGSFMVIYRHLHLLARAEQVDPIPFDCGVCKHHMEASSDDYFLLCMNMRLPVAARLNYKQDFPGMYNHVSQVVYFHDPQYERQPRVSLDQVPMGDPMQILPALCQLHPEIEIMHEEDNVDLSGPTGKWHWVVLPGRVYLAGPDSRIYHSENVTSLLGVYLQATQAQ